MELPTGAIVLSEHDVSPPTVHLPEVDHARPEKYVKLDWDNIIDRARRANGRWILVANAVRPSVMRTIRQKRHRALQREDGELIARPGETVDLPDGTTVMDIYAYWKWADDSYNLLSAKADRPRKITLSEMTTTKLRAVIGTLGESQSEVVRDALLSYVLHGTRYVKEGTSELSVTIPDQLWEQARQRAEDEGLKFSKVVEFEVQRQLRKRSTST